MHWLYGCGGLGISQKPDHHSQHADPHQSPKSSKQMVVMSSGCRREEFAAIKTPRMIQFWPTQISWERKDAIVS